MFRIVSLAVLAAAVVAAQAPSPGKPGKKVNIAHRGASAYAPEHTLEAYRLALEQGADFVEQDLAVTKDGVLVSIHDLTLERTTNVEEVFPDRYSRDLPKSVGAAPPPVAGAGGASPSGAPKRWLVNDFTLGEIRRLDAGSWFDRKFAGARIPTFEEAIEAVRGKAGIYPELKDPAFYRERGIRPDVLIAGVLKKLRLVGDPKTPVIIQSFDAETLRHLARDLPQVPRVYLVEPRDAALLDSAEKMRAIAAWASGVAPNKAIVQNHPEVVKLAHDAGLTVTLWTFRSSTTTFPSVRAEMEKFLYADGVDAVFTDNPDQFPRR